MGLVRVVKTLALVLLIISVADGRKKKSASESTDEGGVFTCTETYIGGYLNGTGDGNYVGWDNGQAEDNITMLDTDIFKDICVGIPYLADAENEILRSTTYTSPGSNGQTVVWSGMDRRLLSAGRRLLADLVYSKKLPDLPSTCDGKDALATCDRSEFDWKCSMVDVEAVMARLREIKKMEGDDCWTTGSPKEFQCEGAPLGPQECTMTPLAAGQYATGMNIVVQGDTCTACSLNADLCPQFYDVHSCSLEWEGVSTTAPAFNTTFTITYEINAAHGGPLPSMLVSTFFAILVIFSS